jgi:protein-arginine kinase activator protein McsA
MKCNNCQKDLTQVLAEIPIWYFQTRGPIVCDACGHENPYEESSRVKSMEIKVSEFYKSNKDSGKSKSFTKNSNRRK